MSDAASDPDAVREARAEMARADAAIQRLRARNQGVDAEVFLRVAERLTQDALTNPTLSAAARDRRVAQAFRIARRATRA